MMRHGDELLIWMHRHVASASTLGRTITTTIITTKVRRKKICHDTVDIQLTTITITVLILMR
jgi:hypothetical protein